MSSLYAYGLIRLLIPNPRGLEGIDKIKSYDLTSQCAIYSSCCCLTCMNKNKSPAYTNSILAPRQKRKKKLSLFMNQVVKQ